MADLFFIFAFYVANFTLGVITSKVFSCILLKFAMLFTNNQFSANNVIFHILRQHLLGVITLKVFHVSSSNLLCMLLITSSRTSSIMAEKIHNSRFIVTFHILYQ